MLFGIWKGLAFNVLILFTAISGFDKSLENAARIDGTKSSKIFWKIKLPQVYPVLAYLIIVGLIHSIKVYEEIVALFGSTTAGPNNEAISLVYYIVQKFYTANDPSVAAVAAFALLLLAFILTLINRVLTKKFDRGAL
jgi:multiple sugar transport system permease protein